MLWAAWTLASKWQTRPSDLYGIHDEFAAFCFDRAVTAFGMAVEDDIRQGTRKAKTDDAAQRKATLILNKWLTMPVEEGERNMQGERKFRDPADRLKKKAV